MDDIHVWTMDARTEEMAMNWKQQPREPTGQYSHMRANCSLRDYFAAEAVSGLARGSVPKLIAKHAYKVADAMMKEREEKK